jgi:hypothetical protein
MSCRGRPRDFLSNIYFKFFTAGQPGPARVLEGPKASAGHSGAWPAEAGPGEPGWSTALDRRPGWITGPAGPLAPAGPDPGWIREPAGSPARLDRGRQLAPDPGWIGDQLDCWARLAATLAGSGPAGSQARLDQLWMVKSELSVAGVPICTW